MNIPTAFLAKYERIALLCLLLASVTQKQRHLYQLMFHIHQKQVFSTLNPPNTLHNWRLPKSTEASATAHELMLLLATYSSNTINSISAAPFLSGIRARYSGEEYQPLTASLSGNFIITVSLCLWLLESTEVIFPLNTNTPFHGSIVAGTLTILKPSFCIFYGYMSNYVCFWHFNKFAFFTNTSIVLCYR